ncbi:MAG: ISAs1 family transposase [Planctomycetaceae bacterium]
MGRSACRVVAESRIAIDGKTLRGSFDQAAGQSPLHTITAFATDTRLVLRQMSVGEKSNEIPAVPVLLQLLELERAVVTLDAMHAQTKTARPLSSERGLR